MRDAATPQGNYRLPSYVGLYRNALLYQCVGAGILAHRIDTCCVREGATAQRVADVVNASATAGRGSSRTADGAVSGCGLREHVTGGRTSAQPAIAAIAGVTAGVGATGRAITAGSTAGACPASAGCSYATARSTCATRAACATCATRTTGSAGTRSACAVAASPGYSAVTSG
ncbi:MAG: hypothetical protein V4443_07565 [Pseudomonadota bacterium]